MEGRRRKGPVTWPGRCWALGLLALACGGGPTAESELSPEEFVEVVVEIRELERELEEADSAEVRFAERKAAILERHAVSEEELTGFIALHGHDLRLMNELWDTISSRLRHVPDGGVPPGLSTGPSDDSLRLDDGLNAAELDSLRDLRQRRRLLRRDTMR